MYFIDGVELESLLHSKLSLKLLAVTLENMSTLAVCPNRYITRILLSSCKNDENIYYKSREKYRIILKYQRENIDEFSIPTIFKNKSLSHQAINLV